METTEFAGYDDLPASIRGLYAPKEYAWLSDRQKANLLRDELEPECDE